LSLHHRGTVLKGEKVVVQLMLEWDADGAEDEDEYSDTVASWLDVVACTI